MLEAVISVMLSSLVAPKMISKNFNVTWQQLNTLLQAQRKPVSMIHVPGRLTRKEFHWRHTVFTTAMLKSCQTRLIYAHVCSRHAFFYLTLNGHQHLSMCNPASCST